MANKSVPHRIGLSFEASDQAVFYYCDFVSSDSIESSLAKALLSTTIRSTHCPKSTLFNLSPPVTINHTMAHPSKITNNRSKRYVPKNKKQKKTKTKGNTNGPDCANRTSSGFHRSTLRSCLQPCLCFSLFLSLSLSLSLSKTFFSLYLTEIPCFYRFPVADLCLRPPAIRSGWKILEAAVTSHVMCEL
ncbi:hypothetical protein VNO77_18714 [Canavalia gladiata]|uniref:Uncharacterized protein n=1 Tax=Canavalia gladiata TaxID=3824 RepID=A0AAN9LLC0_CANGL